MRPQRLHLVLGASRVRSSAEYQPETQASPKGASASFRALRLARELVAEFHALEPGLLRLGQAGFERRLAAEFAQVVVRPADGIGPDPDRHRLLPLSLSISLRPAAARAPPHIARAPPSTSLARRHFRHRDVPPMPAGIGRRHGIGVDDDDGRAVGLAGFLERVFERRRCRRPSRRRAETRRMGAKSIVGSVTCLACARRLLKLSPPVARCSRLMQPKPRLSSTTMVSFRPSITEVAISEFIMR